MNYAATSTTPRALGLGFPIENWDESIGLRHVLHRESSNEPHLAKPLFSRKICKHWHFGRLTFSPARCNPKSPILLEKSFTTIRQELGVFNQSRHSKISLNQAMLSLYVLLILPPSTLRLVSLQIMHDRSTFIGVTAAVTGFALPATVGVYSG